MTKEEAITCLQEKYDYCKSFYDLAAHPEEDYPEMTKYLQALQIALTALRPITREQVGKMRGEWTTDGVCSRCGFDAMYYKGVPVQVRTNYCPACGSPMTDKAVDMVMKRLEALHSETKTD